MSKIVPIDFEYFNSANPKLDLVCCSLKDEGKVYEYWLNGSARKDLLIEHLLKIREKGSALMCWNAIAEGRSLLSLGIDIRKFNWIDLQIEYKMMLNHNHKYEYGNQFIKGMYKKTVPPKNKYRMNEEEKREADSSKPDTNLLSATYNLLEKKVDKEYKDAMRDLILTRDVALINKNKKEIMKYCSGDIGELEEIWDIIKSFYQIYFERKNTGVFSKEVFYRGETGARTAIMEHVGYPINRRKITNLAMNAPIIKKDIIEDANSQFEWALFSPNKSQVGYKQNQKEWREYISNSEYGIKWTKTKPSTRHPNGQLSLALDAFTKVFSFRHNFPEGNFFAQAIRYLKTNQVLNGLVPSATSVKEKKTIFDAIGSDGRVRTYLNPYGSQSGRWQPPARAFIFLKPAWMRGVVECDNAICSVDYKSEEALIGALNSNDKAMIAAYAAGDVYFDFAKRAGAVPKDAVRADYEDIRDKFKATYLGISYLMGAEALALKITGDTGQPCTKKQAQNLIDLFYQSYPDYKRYLDDVAWTYNRLGYWKLDDGWIMFGDNDNFRSVSNLPIQGMGSCILRKAIALAQDAGLKVIFPLHDALYIEYAVGDFTAIDKLAECMEQAFLDLYPNNESAKLIRLDIDTWSRKHTEEKTLSTPAGRKVNMKIEYIDDRAKEEYEKFKKYM